MLGVSRYGFLSYRFPHVGFSGQATLQGSALRERGAILEEEEEELFAIAVTGDISQILVTCLVMGI